MWRPWDEQLGEENASMEVEIEHESDENSFTIEPKKSQFLSPDAKQIILNVYSTLKERDQVPDEHLIKETADLTRSSYWMVWNIVKYGIMPRKTRKDKGVSRKLTEEEHAHMVRKIIYDSFKSNYVPTLKFLQEKILECSDLHCSQETIRKFLSVIGFSYGVIDKRQVLKESRKISEWRFKYLQNIKKMREENRPIIYLDETWYDSHDTVKKGWVDKSANCSLNVPPARGYRIIILHAGSNDGWVPDALYLSAKNIRDANVDYHREMTGDVFFEWFSKKLLPNLPEKSVIVLDNASYHSVQSVKIPNTNSRKEEIQNFLLEHDLFFEEDYTKKQLLEVLHTKEFEKTYVIDDVVKNRYEILRLPPYHCEFNPIEMIWSILKSRVRRNNTNPKFSSGAVEVIKEQVNTITKEEWSNCIQKVISIENEYRSKQVQELIINLTTEDSDHDIDSEGSENP